MYKSIIRPFLFKTDPERIHDDMISYLSVLERNKWMRNYVCDIFSCKDKRLEKQIDSLCFINPIGLSAGFDKNGEAIDAFSCFGFGFVEIGTITPLPQTGNNPPRIFRLPKDEALVSRTGFNNQGADHILERIMKQDRAKHLILGVNINKNDNTSPENAWKDFLYCFRNYYNYVDYFTLNTPATPADLLTDDSQTWFREVIYKLTSFRDKQDIYRPIFLKIPADYSDEQILSVGQLCFEMHIDGVTATGPSMQREGLTASSEDEIKSVGNGALCGHPLKNRSLHAVSLLKKNFSNKITIIGAGGILNESDAKEMLEAGADLIQIYSAFIYNGPKIVKRIKQAILDNK
ncbi:MAG: quinone-dependent dihydroorotate dehydrogenase [Bacteroidales bacterium]